MEKEKRGRTAPVLGALASQPAGAGMRAPFFLSAPRPPALAFALLLSFMLLSLFLLSGCVNPNSNLSYSSCCAKSDTPYACTVALDSKGNPIPPDSKTGMQDLANCGPCAKLGADGTVYNSNGDAIDSGQCANNCNFRESDCSGADQKSTCYLLLNNAQAKDAQGQPISIAPICANATPNPCIQSQCSARMCGEPVPNPKGRMDSDSTSKAAEPSNTQTQGSYLKLAQSEQPTGLVNKVCTYQKMDQRANRLLQAKGWFVDSLRLGVSGTFSDYDRARNYLPPSDFYCSRTTPGAVVDRFTTYLDNGQALPVFRTGSGQQGICKPRKGWLCDWKGETYPSEKQCDAACSPDPCSGYVDDWECPLNGYTDADEAACNLQCTQSISETNFQTRISYCEAALDSSPPYTILSYRCAVDPSLTFSVASLGSPEAALLACNNACSANRFRACTDNSILLTTNQQVSPPGYKKVVEWPFTDINAYSKALAAAYPTPPPDSPDENTNKDPRNYYKKLLPPTNP
ncbi:MAG: hypothetical protein M1530_02940, partial [Candidatus Marsarchaeota archaeon]|nr:hypothetical protein [Candidatus Marsarchaeota archaeon]